MLIGATLKKEEIAYWEPKLSANQWMRIFPAGTGVPANWSDSRYAYCQRVGAIPFISGKMNGDATKIEAFRKQLIAAPWAGTPGGWITTLYVTDHHEPEGDVGKIPGWGPAMYKDSFNAVLTMINGLPANIRARIKCGPVMTKQWTENTGGRSYADWDPGTGDFYAVDCYLNSWSPSDSSTAFTVFPNAAAWLSTIKGYRFDGLSAGSTTDHRTRIFAELGGISPPWDTDGTARAAFYQAVHDEVSTWKRATQGWDFGGYIFWNTEGTGGLPVGTVGTRRWFNFDRRHDSTDYKWVTKNPDGTETEHDDPIGGYTTIATGSAKVLIKYNALVTGGTSGGGGTASPQQITPAGVPTGNRFGAPTLTGGAAPTTPPPTIPPVVPPPGSVVTPGSPVVTPANLTGVAAFTFLITGGDLKPLLPPLKLWRDFDVTLTRNQAGSGVVTCTASPAVLTAAATPNARMVIIQNPVPVLGITGKVLASGPIEHPGPYGWSVDDEDGQGEGTVKISFTTNEVYLAERRVYPNPATDATSQGAAFYTATGINAEVLMRQLVNLNAGPGAISYRRVPNLALPVSPTGVGTTVAYSGRFDVLTDALRTIALAGGGLNFRVRDTGPGGQLLFEVYAPTTRANVLFARSRGNLRALAVDPESPTATAAIVGGAGTGASRTVYEYRPATLWRRMETFVNQNTGTTAELQQAGVEELADKGEKVGLTATAIDPWGQGYGAKYLLGDRVPVQLNTGVIRTDYVQSVKITGTADGGAVFTPSIGGTDPYQDSATVRLIRDMNRRLRRLEGS